MKVKIKIYFRSLLLTLTVILCLFVLFDGTAKAYKAIRKDAFGEYKSAFEISDDYIRIFDYKIKAP